MAHKPASALPSSQTDARAIKSGQALQRALLLLLETRPFDDITIREITAQAGVNYATFFRHYATKKALLDHLAADQIEQLVALTVPILDSADTLTAATALFAYVNERHAAWRALLTGGAAGVMREELLRISSVLAVDRAHKDGLLPVDLAVAYCVSLIFETLAWWLARPTGAVSIADVAGHLNQVLSSLMPDGAVDSV